MTAAQSATTAPTARETWAEFGGGVPALARHPQDGWKIGAPYPMGPPARAALRGLTRILCPAGAASLLPDLEDRIEHNVRVTMRYMPALLAWGLKIGIRAVDWAPRVLFRSTRLLHQMERTAAAELLARLGRSPIAPVRDLVWAARGLVLATFFDQDEVHAAMRYAPIPWLESRIALRQRILNGQPTTAADLIPSPRELAP